MAGLIEMAIRKARFELAKGFKELQRKKEQGLASEIEIREFEKKVQKRGFEYILEDQYDFPYDITAKDFYFLFGKKIQREISPKYKGDIWKRITEHPDFDLGGRELKALELFLREYGKKIKIKEVGHLGSGEGKEISPIIENISGIEEYFLFDICETSLSQAFEKSLKYPNVKFSKVLGNIEIPGKINEITAGLNGATMIVLVANGVLFSNPEIEKIIYEAMKPEDIFLTTIEMPHEGMFDSYKIEPIYELIDSPSWKTELSYDEETHLMKMSTKYEDLMVSYKPTAEALRERMKKAGFKTVYLESYQDIHMLAGIFEKK